MKVDYISPKLVRYHLDFTKLHIPLLALTQLYIAYFRAYIAGFLNNRMGMPRSFVLLLKQFLVSSVFFFMAYFAGKKFLINPKSVAFIIITGLAHVSVSQQTFSRAQGENGPFISACYQPMAPALSTIAAILLGYEKGTVLKYSGVAICTIITLARFFYDDFYDIYNGRHFIGKYFLFMNLIFTTIGVITQKNVLSANPNVSLIVLVFYIYFSGFL